MTCASRREEGLSILHRTLRLTPHSNSVHRDEELHWRTAANNKKPQLVLELWAHHMSQSRSYGGSKILDWLWSVPSFLINKPLISAGGDSSFVWLYPRLILEELLPSLLVLLLCFVVMFWSQTSDALLVWSLAPFERNRTSRVVCSKLWT